MERALFVVGNRWVLLILRDAFLGVRRFEDFQRRLGLARNILTERLASLVECGVFDRAVYQTRPVRRDYHLTEKGNALYPVVLSLAHWSEAHFRHPDETPTSYRHTGCGHEMRSVMACSECGEPLEPQQVEVRTGDDLSHHDRRPILSTHAG